MEVLASVWKDYYDDNDDAVCTVFSPFSGVRGLKFRVFPRVWWRRCSQSFRVACACMRPTKLTLNGSSLLVADGTLLYRVACRISVF